MALPTSDIMRVQVGGAIPSDTWSIGFWFEFTGLATTPTPAQMNSAANGFLSGFNTLFWNVATNPWKLKASTATNLSTSKAYLYRSGALVASGAASMAAVAGTGGSPMPNYVARCVTLLTNQPGRSRRGRVYLPANGDTVTAATGLNTTISAQLTNLASLFSTSSGAQSTGYFFGGSEVASFVVVSATHGYTTHITSLRADNKPDTQHGRENKLVPTITDSVTI